MTAFGQLFTNNAAALLDASISQTDTTIRVQPGFGDLFPSPSAAYEFFLITLENAASPAQREIVKISQRVGDVFTVATNGRGWEGTTPQSWTAGDTLVDHRVTAGTLMGLQGNFGEPALQVAVGSGESKVANSLDITQQNKTCKWIVTIQTADNRIAMTEVLAVYKPAPNQPKFTEYARVGDRIRYTINVIGTPTHMILEVSNNDTSAFTSVDVIRLQHYT